MSETANLILNPLTSKVAISESFKNLRTNLIYSNDAHIITVTSTIPNEGKTYNAYNLAISFAQMEKRVLLVDCDLRKGTLRKYFSMGVKGMGLSEALSFQTGDIIHNTNLPDLDVVFSGKIPPNPSELLSNGFLELMIEKLKAQYDYIIFDTPPMAVSMDATILGRMSDGVVLVVRSDFVSRKEVKKSVQQLQRNGCKCLGAVLNGVKKSQSEYKYSYYGYEYYSKEADKK